MGDGVAGDSGLYTVRKALRRDIVQEVEQDFHVGFTWYVISEMACGRRKTRLSAIVGAWKIPVRGVWFSVHMYMDKGWVLVRPSRYSARPEP
jgi:hypothetical protein